MTTYRMEVSTCLTCPCTGKTYKCIKSHYKTNVHLMWEQNKDQKDMLIRVNKLENENGHLRRLNMILMERISELEK